ncbi:MAG: hypothetical protein ACR2OB_00495 [Solirubrobacteraceae bacterium]
MSTPIKQAATALRALAAATRPVAAEIEDALRRRWSELPEPVRTPAQLLGRRSPGCEGTHGVFPRCNLACTRACPASSRWIAVRTFVISDQERPCARS